jgi:hypothetical protein
MANFFNKVYVRSRWGSRKRKHTPANRPIWKEIDPKLDHFTRVTIRTPNVYFRCPPGRTPEYLRKACAWYVSLVDSAASVSAHAANVLVSVDGLKCGLSFTVALARTYIMDECCPRGALCSREEDEWIYVYVLCCCSLRVSLHVYVRWDSENPRPLAPLCLSSCPLIPPATPGAVCS